MNLKTRFTARIFTVTAVSLTLLSGCGGSSFSMWPFGDSGSTELSRKPVNAAEYRCEGNKSFFVRNLDASAVWLIAPDREIRLVKPSGGAEMVYASGKVRLELSGPDAQLLDPPALFAGCKRVDAK